MSHILRRLMPPLAVALALVLTVALPASAHKRAQFPAQSVGDRGADVVALQHLLRARGKTVTVSGYFGSETRTALISFQQQAGLGGSGVAFVSTWEALAPNLTLGSAGEAVAALKKQLNDKRRAGLTLTTSFDAETRDAVRALQQHMGIGVTGNVDRTTWRNLIWHYLRPDFSRPGLCNYNGGSTAADWGKASAVGHLQAAAALFNSRTGGQVAVGDISFEHGGQIDLHQTHEHGLDIDIALVRLDGRQCSNPGISYTSKQYDRADTRQMLEAFHEALGGHLKLIYFNDPQMVSARLSQSYPNHDDHIHVRICEPAHDLVRYTC